MMIILFVCVLSCLLGLANGSCMSLPMPGLSNGRPLACQIGPMRIELGDYLSIPAPICMNCSCIPGMLSCCGYGYRGGKIWTPEGCSQITKPDSCDILIVDSQDNDKPCPGWNK